MGTRLLLYCEKMLNHSVKIIKCCGALGPFPLHICVCSTIYFNLDDILWYKVEFEATEVFITLQVQKLLIT